METMPLFGQEHETKKNKICVRSIRAVFKDEVVREDAPTWVTTTCNSPNNTVELFQHLAQETKEHFVALHLDTKNRILCYDTVSIGSLSAAIVHPREVFKTALLSSAAAILLLHNHPSGDPKPSREDAEITKRLVEVGELLGIRVLDHLILGEKGAFYSFSENKNL